MMMNIIERMEKIYNLLNQKYYYHEKIGIFIAGVITGAVLMIVLAVALSNKNMTRVGVTLFEKEGECISKNTFEVFQVLDSGDALAHELGEYSTSTGLVVLFLSKGDTSYYDEQVIKVRDGKCVRQIGVYKYSTRSGREKTVPVVEIRDE